MLSPNPRGSRGRGDDAGQPNDLGRVPPSPLPRRRPLQTVAMLAVAGILVIVGAFALWPDPRPEQTSMPTYTAPVSTAANAGSPDLTSPDLVRLYDADNAVSSFAARVGSRVVGPKQFEVATASGPRSFLLLGAGKDGKPKTYTLPGLARVFGQDVQQRAPGEWIVNRSVVVAKDATLLVSAPSVQQLLLRSDGADYVTITGNRGGLVFEGTAAAPLQVTSFATASAGPDTGVSDGRAYVRTKGGDLAFRDAKVSHLGFLIGEASGVAWMSAGGLPGTGGALRTTFERNYFGAYTSGAVGLRIDGAQFNDNSFYGFDPHTNTREILVTNSSALRNGRHGIILSRGCDDNIIENTVSSNNGGSGFYIDDGNPDRSALDPSDRNVLRGIRAENNGAAGVIVEGGQDNHVLGASLQNNVDGIWVKDRATGTVISDSTVTATARTGLRFGTGSDRAQVTGTTVSGARTGLLIADTQATALAQSSLLASSVGVRLVGDVTGTSFEEVTVSGSGSAAVNDGESSLHGSQLAGLDTSAWVYIDQPSWRANVVSQVLLPFAFLVWTIILLPPLLAFVPSARHRRREQARLRQPPHSPGW